MIFRSLVLASLAAAAKSQCVVCGDGKSVTNPEVVWQLPGQPAVQCGLLETVGSQGLIPDSFCALLPPLIAEPCGCAPAGGEPTAPVAPVAPVAPSAAPVVPPTEAPVVPPTEAPVVPPTDAPVVPPTEAPVVPPTEAPVVPPTEAPVVPATDAPVVPATDAPVSAAPVSSAPVSAAPVVSSTDAPVAAPTDAPVVSPTDSPVASPTDAPVSPTGAPVAPPTDAPVAPPTDAPVTAVPVATDAPVTAVPVTTAAPVTDSPAGCTDLAKLACSTDFLSDLCGAILFSELGDALSSGEWTVFAPTNKAFEELGEILGDLTADTEILTNILLFHAVNGVLGSKDLECKETIAMANGQDSRTVCKGKSIFIKGGGNPRNDMPKIVTADIETCQGYVHVIDEVMIPAKLTLPTVPCKTFNEQICDNEATSAFCEVAEAFELNEFPEGEWTLFIPNNAAFESLGVELEPERLENVLKFHAVEGKIMTAQELKCGKRIEMANGKDSRHVCRGDGKYMRGGGNILSDTDAWPQIIDTDIMTCNGIIHILDGVMLPNNF